ncbi:MAG TPA: hypothetical protein PKA82_11590 [Pyrinomonadaceae bacterium]|nr:hypothetical protein [Pyrinomonadaceae bacterium]
MIRHDGISIRRSWEVCERANVESRWTSNYVSLNRLGDIVLNRVAFKYLGEPEAVQLLYDRDSHTIGLKPVGSDADHAFPVRPRGNRGGYRIRANRLMREFGISLDETLMFRNTIRDRNGIMILNINDTDILKSRQTW